MGKKLLVVALFATLLASMVGAQAHGRTVEGTILAPTTDVGIGLVTRHARCAYLAAGHDADGLVGWVVDLAAGEGDGTHTFSLTATGGNPDIVFYSDLGTCDNAPAAVTTGQKAGDGAESGTIPADSTHAIIVVRDGANVPFSFTIA